METRPVLDDQERADEAIATYSEGAARLSRKRLLLTAATGAGGALAAALVVPAFSLGPNATKVLSESPWRRGRRVVDDAGRPIRAVDVGVGSFRTGFPEHALEGAARLRDRRRPDPRRRARSARRPPRLGARRASSPSRRSARTRAARSRSSATRRSTTRRPGRRSSAPATTRRSPSPTAARARSGPAARSLPQLPLAVDDGGLPGRRLATSRVASARPGGRCARDQARRPVPRVARRLVGSRQEGARLCLPRPLVVPARRDRALLLPRPRRDGHLPDVLLRAELRARRLPRRVRAAARDDDDGGVPLDGRPLVPVEGRAADPADAPLGRERLHRRDRHAPVPHLPDGRVPQAARPERLDRDDDARPRRLRGLRGLLAARRPAVGHGARDRLLGRALGPRDRRVARDGDLGRRVPGQRRVHRPPVHRPRPDHPRRDRGADHDAPRDHRASEARAVPRPRPHRAQRRRSPALARATRFARAGCCSR